MKQDKTVARTLDMLGSTPIKFRFKHNKKHTNNQRRSIRRAFNRIQPEFVRGANLAVSELLSTGQCELAIR